MTDEKKPYQFVTKEEIQQAEDADCCPQGRKVMMRLLAERDAALEVAIGRCDYAYDCGGKHHKEEVRRIVTNEVRNILEAK